MSQNLRTICDFTRFAVSEFERHGVSLGHGSEDYWQEATFLVLRTLKLPFDRLEAFWNAHLTDAECAMLLKNIEKRAVEKIPAAYILGEAWLTGHSFKVTSDTLIPRSFIAELLEENLAPWVENREEVTSVLDLCTGSGCLAILAQEVFPNATVTGADISDKALAVAKENVHDYGFDEELNIVKSDVFSGLEGQKFDIILCNPPYVTTEAMEELPAEYQKEPALALDAGADGMDFMRRFMAGLSEHLTDVGQAFVEIGDGRDAFEALWPNLNVTWLEVSGGDSLVFRVTTEELKAAHL